MKRKKERYLSDETGTRRLDTNSSDYMNSLDVDSKNKIVVEGKNKSKQL